ncbi:MAG TPA: hypothetical protein VGD10_12490 [Allosphingosinicella sp.]|uniref:hypothetical protein n=1 Tax=Allosphingosinicella sp. TaxID=2823234 RepID=UPI002ED9442E
MPLPFTHAQVHENGRFLEVLGQTGNARLAAREVKRAHSTMHERRTKDAAFAQRWDAAVAAAHARFHLGGGRRGPEAEPGPERKGKKALRQAQGERVQTALGSPQPCRGHGDPFLDRRGLRTKGGEAVVVRTRSGKLQLRPAHRGKLTKTCEQLFLRALAASANVRLSAAAAGASARAFYRRRAESPVFAREMRLALETGYDRLQMMMIEQAAEDEDEAFPSQNGWRAHAGEDAMPRMTAGQALQLLYLHRKSIVMGSAPAVPRRRSEPREVFLERMRIRWTADRNRAAEDRAAEARAAARAARYEETGSWRMADEAEPPKLPPLELVTGWSRARGEAPHDADVALFGGWRIREMRKKMEGDAGVNPASSVGSA